MEFICSQEEIKKALMQSAKAVPSRPTHPILGNILFSVENDVLSLTGFNLNLAIISSISVESIVDGSITLPSNILINLIGKLPSQELRFQLSENTVKIITENGTFSLQGIDDSEYPEIPQVTSEKSLLLTSDTLIDGFKKTCFAASSDDTKQVLTGVHFMLSDNTLELAATDGHRLSVMKTEVENPEDYELTIPSYALNELLKIIEPRQDIKMSFEDGYIQVKSQNTTFIVRILDGTYPNYNSLIPTQFSYSIVVNKVKLVQALEILSVFNTQKNNTFKAEFFKDKIILTMDEKEVGRGRQTLDCQALCSLEDSINIGFNIKYVLDGLKKIDSDEVYFKWNTPQGPAIFTGLVDQMLYLVMPIQIRE